MLKSFARMRSGKFRDLLGAVAKSSAMLYYLDNWQSVADSGRPTLATAPGVLAGNGKGARVVAANPRLAAMTVGELMDQKLMAKPQLNRLSHCRPSGWTRFESSRWHKRR